MKLQKIAANIYFFLTFGIFIYALSFMTSYRQFYLYETKVGNFVKTQELYKLLERTNDLIYLTIIPVIILMLILVYYFDIRKKPLVKTGYIFGLITFIYSSLVSVGLFVKVFLTLGVFNAADKKWRGSIDYGYVEPNNHIILVGLVLYIIYLALSVILVTTTIKNKKIEVK